MVYKLQVISWFICRLCSIIVCVIFALKRKISYLQKKHTRDCSFFGKQITQIIVPSFLLFFLKELCLHFFFLFEGSAFHFRGDCSCSHSCLVASWFLFTLQHKIKIVGGSSKIWENYFLGLIKSCDEFLDPFSFELGYLVSKRVSNLLATISTFQ